MTDEAISPLRRRMIEDMTIRKFAPKTQHDYVQRIKNFAAFLGRSPDTASFEDVRRYQLHLAASGVGVPTVNQTVSTLRFFFRVTLRRPFGGPEVVLAYLARYTHRVAIANRRLVAFDGNRVTFRRKDYRIEGRSRYKLMTLDAGEFIRRFLIHVLPHGLHRIRHYGLFASARAQNIARARQLLQPRPQTHPANVDDNGGTEPPTPSQTCPRCGRHMMIIETFKRGFSPRHHPTSPMVAIRIDTS